MAQGFQVSIAGISDVGCVRQVNEDSIGWDVGLGLAVLADGMGGHNAGDVASKMAVENLLHILRGAREINRQTVLAAINAVNESIYSLARSKPEYARMGTTLALLCLTGPQVMIAHLGDSRVYRHRVGEWLQLTEDHSLMTQMIKEGVMQPEDAARSQYKNVITRALGVREVCEADIVEEPWQQDDIYLLCSDGLSNLVDSVRLRDMVIRNRPDWGQAGKELIEAANQAGGQDNISALIVHVTAAKPL